MAKPPRDRVSARTNTYFNTTRAFEGQALFQPQRAAKLLIETILVYREQERYLLHEFVVMPNHLHLLISPVAPVALE
jgi:putative transposase